MTSLEDNESPSLVMQPERTELADGRYLVYYSFTDALLRRDDVLQKILLGVDDTQTK